jgi:hypothetical protein
MPETQLWFPRRVEGIVNVQTGGIKAAAGLNRAGDLDA